MGDPFAPLINLGMEHQILSWEASGVLYFSMDFAGSHLDKLVQHFRAHVVKAMARDSGLFANVQWPDEW